MTLYKFQGTVSHAEVNGSVVVRNFLVGSLQLKMVFNDDLAITDARSKGNW